MGLKKLNKAEVTALANKVKTTMTAANQAARDVYLAKHREQIDTSAQLALDEILSLSPNASSFIEASLSYSKNIDVKDIIAHLEDKILKKCKLPYREPEETGWRQANRFEEAIVLAQLEAENIDGLIEAVTEQFKGE